QAFEVVACLDDPLVRLDLEPQLLGKGPGGFLCPLQRGGHQVGDVVAGEVSGGGAGRVFAAGGEPVAGQATVEDPIRVVDLAVANQMHDGCHACRAYRPGPPAPKPPRLRQPSLLARGPPRNARSPRPSARWRRTRSRIRS